MRKMGQRKAPASQLPKLVFTFAIVTAIIFGMVYRSEQLVNAALGATKAEHTDQPSPEDRDALRDIIEQSERGDTWKRKKSGLR